MRNRKYDQTSEFDSDPDALNETRRNDIEPDVLESFMNDHDHALQDSMHLLSRQVSEESMA